MKPNVMVLDSQEGQNSNCSYASRSQTAQFREEACQTEIQLIEPLFNILDRAKKQNRMLSASSQDIHKNYIKFIQNKIILNKSGQSQKNFSTEASLSTAFAQGVTYANKTNKELSHASNFMTQAQTVDSRARGGLVPDDADQDCKKHNFGFMAQNDMTNSSQFSELGFTGGAAAGPKGAHQGRNPPYPHSYTKFKQAYKS